MSAHRSFLILFNIAKDSNFGYLLRIANAFDCEPVVIGRRHWRRTGAVANTRRTPVHHFPTLTAGIQFVRQAGSSLTGIEIDPNAQRVGDDPFDGPTAFIPGNEGTGLTAEQRELCDNLVYIPQFGTAGSINVNAATAIILHRFATWAGKPEIRQSSGKFCSELTLKSQHTAFRQRQVG